MRFLASPPWRYWEYFGPALPNHLVFKTKVFLAHVDWTKREYDYINFDVSWPRNPELYGMTAFRGTDTPLSPANWSVLTSIWKKIVPTENQARIICLGLIPYERVVLIDDLGDCCNEGPHVIVQRRPKGELFEERNNTLIFSGSQYGPQKKLTEEWKFTPFFDRFENEFLDLCSSQPDLLSSTRLEPVK